MCFVITRDGIVLSFQVIGALQYSHDSVVFTFADVASVNGGECQRIHTVVVDHINVCTGLDEKRYE